MCLFLSQKQKGKSYHHRHLVFFILLRHTESNFVYISFIFFSIASWSFFSCFWVSFATSRKIILTKQNQNLTFNALYNFTYWVCPNFLLLFKILTMFGLSISLWNFWISSFSFLHSSSSFVSASTFPKFLFEEFVFLLKVCDFAG